MNSELEKLIEKYRITVNGLADLESGYDQVIKERGFVTLNGLLAATDSPAGENTVNTETHNPSGDSPSGATENTPVVDPAPVEPTPVVPAAPAPSEPAVENPGVTPVTEGPVSNDTNLGNEVSGEGSNERNPSGERSVEEEDSSEEETVAGGKPKKKKATSRTAPSEEK